MKGSSDDVAVVVLAGGEGSRIGGNKPLLRIGSERLIDRAIGLARTYSKTVAIAVRDCAQVPDVDAQIINDDPVEGPLGGLIAALRFARAENKPMLLVIPTDMPFLPADLLSRLQGAIGDHPCVLAKSSGRVHPVCSLWRTKVADRIAAYVATGRRSLHGFAEFVGATVEDWQAIPEGSFFNINSAEDLAAGERRTGGSALKTPRVT